ncbi:MAG: hypothetical protein Q9165_007566 [Trypethelium subeluteriae]
MAPKRKKQDPTEVAVTATETSQRVQATSRIPSKKAGPRGKERTESRPAHQIQGSQAANATPKAASRRKTSQTEDDVKGLVKQHIESFNYFVETELQKIIDVNREIRSDVDHKFFLR